MQVMQSIITEIENKQRKHHVAPVTSGDTVRVHQRIDEGGKSRVQVFEGLAIRTRRLNSLSAVVTVRRIASGVGVEKTFPLHSPTIEKVEIVKRSNVRRNYLSYMRERTGKRARLANVDFDRAGVNYVPDPASEKLPEEAEKAIENAKAEQTEKAAEQPTSKEAVQTDDKEDSKKTDSDKDAAETAKTEKTKAK